MDGQQFDPKFGTEVKQPAKVVEPIKTRDEFIQGLIVNQSKPKPQSWFNVNNFVEEDETLAEQTGASEFAAGVVRNNYDPSTTRKLGQVDIPDVDDKPVASPTYDPTQDNKWLYGRNISVTRYEALRRLVGLGEGQSFTEYYNVNKFVPSGYELDAKLLLREEKIKALENKMLNGEMGYDTFLYRAYGKDLLKMNGHDFSSSLYWYTRRKNGQFDSVKNNLAFMDQILRTAERSYLAEAWNRTANTLTVDTIEGAVASEKPISPELMRDLFPQLFEALDKTIDNDRKIMDLYLSGQIGPSMFKPYIDTDGDGKIDYYLHLDGRLYSAKAENEAGENDARVIYNDKGELEEIYLPGAWSFDRGVTESAFTQFAKIFYGVPELIGYAGAALFDLGEGIFGQGFDFSSLGDFYTWSQKFQNSTGVFSNQFYVEDATLFGKDGDINVMNAVRGVADGIGMVAGMITLAGVAGYLGKGAAAASNTFKGTQLSLDTAKNFGYKMSQIKGFLPKVAYGVGSMASRVSMIKNGMPLLSNPANLWAMSGEAALYLAGRDFLNTAAELSSRQDMTGITTEDIFARTLEMTAVNAAITFTLRSINDVGMTDRFAQLFKSQKISNSLLTNLKSTGLGKAAVGWVTPFTKATPLINTIGDAFENWATMAMNIGVAQNSEDYSPGESLANFLTGSVSMGNNPSALAMQIFQGVQTYRGSLGRDLKTGQETRDIISAVGYTRSTMQGVESDFRTLLVKATGEERTALETLYNKWLDIRKHAYEFKVDNRGEITFGKRQVDEKGNPILTKDPDASDLASLLWLKKTLTGKVGLNADEARVPINDMDIVSKNLKKTIDRIGIEKFVTKQQLIYGAYNSFMDNQKAKFEEFLKNPESIKKVKSKAFNIYKAVEGRLGKERDAKDYAGTNKLSAAARLKFFEALERVRSNNFQDQYIENDLALLGMSDDYRKALSENMDLLEISTYGGKLILDQLTVENLLAIAQKRDKTKGQLTGKNTSFNNDKGFLIKLILTNLTTAELKEDLANFKSQNESGSGDLILRVKGAGTKDEKKKDAITKMLDILIYWEGKIKEVNPDAVSVIRKIKDDTYVLGGQLENSSFTLNVVDYVGSFLRGITAIKLQNLAGTDTIAFKETAFANLMDRFNNAESGTFKKKIDSKDAETVKQANDFINLLIQNKVLTYDEALEIYNSKYKTDSELKNEKSIARYADMKERLDDLRVRAPQAEKNLDPKFNEDLVFFISLFDGVKDPEFKKQFLASTGLTIDTLNKLRQNALGGLVDLKKTLGNLLRERLQARLTQAGSPGGIDSLGLEEFLNLVVTELNDVRFGRTKGIPQEQRIEYVNLVLEKFALPKEDPRYANLNQNEYEAVQSLIQGFKKDIGVLDSFRFGSQEEIQNLLGNLKLTLEERTKVLNVVRQIKIDIVKEIAVGEAAKLAINQSSVEAAKVLEEAKASTTQPKKKYFVTPPNEKTYLPIKDQLKIADNPTLRTKGIPFEVTGQLNSDGSFTKLRAYVVVEYNGVKIPFYFSSGSAGKDELGVTSQRWYPITGISEEWINKGTVDELVNFYDSSVLRAISEWLSDTLGDPNPEIKKYVQGFVKKFPNRYELILNKEQRDYFSQGFNPTGNPETEQYNEIVATENKAKIIELAKVMDSAFDQVKGNKVTEPPSQALVSTTEQQVVTEAFKQKAFEDYVNEEYDRRTIALPVKEGSRSLEQKLEYLIQEDPFFIRNAGSNIGLQLDDEDENSLINLARFYLNNFILGSNETPTSGKVYVNLNSFMGPARRKLFNYIANADAPLTTPISTKMSSGQIIEVLKSLGVPNPEQFAQELYNEFRALDKFISENPNGQIVFDLTTSNGEVQLSNFLKAFNLKASLSILKNNLADFGIYGFAPDDGGVLKGHRTFDFLTNENFKASDLIREIEKKEKALFEQRRKVFSELKESYVSKTDSLFSNALYITEDSMINDVSSIILSAIRNLDQVTLDQLRETIGQVIEGEKVKSGKAGGLSVAINQAQILLSATEKRDTQLYSFKLFKSMVDYLVEYRTNTPNRKAVQLRKNSLDEIKEFEDTGVWDVSYVKKTESGQTYYIVDLKIKDLNKEGFTNALINWIKNSKGNSVNFGLLVPRTAADPGLRSAVSSDTTSAGEDPNLAQSSGTGDTPFGVLYRTVGYGVDILEIFKNNYIFNLADFELTNKSYDELQELVGLSVKTIITKYKDSKNPYIRMAVNTLDIGQKLSKLYLEETSKRIPNIRKETIQLFLNPRFRKMFGAVLQENENATMAVITAKLDQAYNNIPSFEIDQRANISSLEQYGIEAQNDFVSSATLSSFRPSNMKLDNYKFNEKEVEFFKKTLDDDFLVTTEEANAIYNPFSNIKNALIYSNDEIVTEQKLSRQGGQVIKIDVEALFAMSDVELQELDLIIESLKSNFKSVGVIKEKLEQVRSLRRSGLRLRQGEIRLQSVGTPSNKIDTTLIAKADGNKLDPTDAVPAKIESYAESFRTKADESLKRTSRYRLNSVLKNEKMPEEQNYAKYLNNELIKLGENASSGQRQVLDLRKDENIARYSFSVAATAKVLKDLIFNKVSGFLGTTQEATQKAFELAKSMMILTDGSDYVSMPTKYLFIDRTTGEIINKASFVNSQRDSAYLNDFFKSLLEVTKNPDTNIVVIELNKNMMTGAGSLSEERFKYIEINDRNKADFLEMAFKNIRYQATNIDELRNAKDDVEIVTGVLGRTITRKIYEEGFYSSFSQYLDSDLIPEDFKFIIRNLIGNLFDTIFHNDGTYTTKQLYEAEELGYEVGDDDKFNALISNADRKISEIITFFINDDSLPQEVKDVFRSFEVDVDAYFANVKYLTKAYVNNLINLKESAVDTLKQNVEKAKEETLKQRSSKKIALNKAKEKYNESVKIFLDEKNKLEASNNVLRQYNQETNKDWNTTFIWVLNRLESDVADETFKKIVLELKTKNPEGFVSKLFFLNQRADKLIEELEQKRIKKPDDLKIVKELNALKRFRSEFEWYQENVISKRNIAEMQNIRQEVAVAKDKIRKQQREYLQLSSIKDNVQPGSLLEAKNNLIKAEAAFNKLREEKTKLYRELKSIETDFKFVKETLNEQKIRLGLKSSLIDNFIEGRLSLKELTGQIKASSEAFRSQWDNEVTSQKDYLTEAFDELIIKYLFKSKDAAAINFRLAKLFKDKDGKQRREILLRLLEKSKDDSIQKTFLNIILSENTNDKKDNYMFDIEAFYETDNVGKNSKTSPFSVSYFKLKKITGGELESIKEAIANGDYKADNWEDFKKILFEKLIETKKTIFVPVYGFNKASGKYVLIENYNDVREYFFDYYSKYLVESKSFGATQEFRKYEQFIKDSGLQKVLTKEQYIRVKDGYVEKQLINDGINFNNSRFVGFNNKEYDQPRLLEEQDGARLINNSKIFDDTIDIYTDIMKGLSSSSTGLRASLEEQRKRYGLSIEDAHSSEDDLFFSLFVFIDQGSRLVDSNKNQTQLIRLLEKVKSSLGLGSLNEEDLSRIENQIESILANGSVKDQDITKTAQNFADIYNALFKKSGLEISKFQKSLMENQAALFRQQEWSKNWNQIMDDLRDVRPDVEELARLSSNEKFQKEKGMAFDFLVHLVYKHVYDNDGAKANNTKEMLTYVDRKSKLSVLELVLKGLSKFNDSNRIVDKDSGYASKEKTLLKTLSLETVPLLKGIITNLKSFDSLKDLTIKNEEVENSFNEYAKSNFNIANFKDFLNESNSNGVNADHQIASETRKLGYALLPLINSFADIEDTVLRNTMIKEMLTMITYDTDDKAIKGRMFGFGKNKALTNIDKVAYKKVLESLAASQGLSFKSMYLAAQGLSNRSAPLKVFTGGSFVEERISDNNYYMSESYFKTMFNIRQDMPLSDAIAYVRSSYGLTRAEQKLFISILRQPSDKPNTLHNYELRIIQNNQGINSTITVDALKANHSGDVDGDKLFIFKPTITQLRVANNITMYQRAALNLIGEVISDVEFEGENVKRYSNKEDFERIKLFEFANRLLKDRIAKDYRTILSKPSKELQIKEFNLIKEEVISLLKNNNFSEQEAKDVIKYSWLELHDVESRVKPTQDFMGLIFTTKNQKLSDTDWAIFNENMFKLSTYVFKNKLGEIDSVTGLYDFAETDSQIIVKGKNSGFGRIFETIGVHITENSLRFIEDNAEKVIDGLINKIEKDEFLKDVFLDRVINPATKRGTIRARDVLIDSLKALKSNDVISRDDIATLIMTVVESYDRYVKSSKDYNNTLFVLSQDKKSIAESEEGRAVSAKEKEQVEAIKALYFSLGIDLEKDKNLDINLIENLHSLLDFANKDRSLNNQVRFSNPNTNLAAKIILNEISNVESKQRNTVLYRNKLGNNPQDWNNYSGTKTIYKISDEGAEFAGNPFIGDVTYTLKESENLLVLNMETFKFNLADDLSVLRKLDAIEPNEVYVVPEGGLKITEEYTIPEGQRIVVAATSTKQKDFFDNFNSSRNPFAVIAFVDSMNDNAIKSNYKINIPGSARQKNTLVSFNPSGAPKAFNNFVKNERIHFFNFLTESDFKKANLFSKGEFKFYDADFNLIDIDNTNIKTAKIAYVVESNNVTLAENTTNWRTKNPETRSLDEPTIINNIGNPEAFLFFGRVNQAAIVSTGKDGQIKIELNTKELQEVKDNLKQLSINEVQENNGLRLMHLMMVKALIFNPILKLDSKTQSNIMQSFFSNTNLNNLSGYKDVLELYKFYYKDLKDEWKNYVKKNPYIEKLFSKELHDKIFQKTPTQISLAERNSVIPTTKQNPVEQAVALGLVTATGNEVTLRTDVKDYDTVKQVGEKFYTDGLAFIGIKDLLNTLLASKKDNDQITNFTINTLAPLIGARKLLANTFSSQYLPILTTDAKFGNTTQPYARANSPKSGTGTQPNRAEILLASETPSILPIQEKDKTRDMYSSDIFNIDETFLNKILSGITYNNEKKVYEFDKNFEIRSSEQENFVRKAFFGMFREAKDYNQRLDFLARNFNKFALQFDLKKVIDENGEIKVSINRIRRMGNIGELTNTLKNVLGSSAYFDASERQKKKIQDDYSLIKAVMESKMNFDWLEMQGKINNSSEFNTYLKKFLEERNVSLKNKEEARAKFLAAYKNELKSADTSNYLQTDFFVNIFEVSSKNGDGDERPQHSVKVGPNKKQTVYVDKNLDEEDVIKLDKLKLTSSGVSEEDQRSFEVSQIVTMLKKEPQQLQGYFLSRLNAIKDLAYRYGIEEDLNLYMWIKGNVYKALLLQQELNKTTDEGKRIALSDQLNSLLSKMQVSSIEELNNKAKNFESVYGDVAKDIQNYTTDIYNAQNITVRNSNEPIPDIYWLILPTIKAGMNKSEYELAKNIILNPRERILSDNGHATYSGYNFFRSIETTVYNLSRHIAAENFSARATNKGVLTNLPVVNFLNKKIWSFILSEEGKRAIDKIDNKYNTVFKIFETMQNTMKSVLNFANTDLENIFINEKDYASKNIVKVYLELKTNIDKFIATSNGMTLAEAQATMKREQPGTLVYNKAQDIYNLHEFSNDILARINDLIGGDVLSKYLFNELNAFANSKGLALADKYGRKFNQDVSKTKALSEMSMEWVSDAISFNIRELGGFEKNIVTKALSGDVYLMDQKLQDHLDKYFYTVKVPTKFSKAIRKLQSIATALIMSNPFKVIDRILKYSLTDLTMMSLANPKTMFKVNDARKDLSSFMQSKGAVVPERLQQYLRTQGVDLNKTNFDYVLNDFQEFEEKGTFFKKYFDTLGKPFEFQTQLIRYSYWLQTVEDLEKGKSNVYGSVYYKKKLIDSIQDSFDSKGKKINSANENKASYIMSQQLGAPGDFPLLAKDLNGIFMFTTFPLALVRWAKGEANSMATAVKNLFVEGEQKEALGWLATQGGGILGSALLVQAIIMLVANLFNVDEETEEEWLKKQALPDVFATLIQGAPVMDIYNTADPIKLLSELTYAPFVEAAQERKEDALYGKQDVNNLTRGNGLLKWAFQNVLGKVNPAFKDPIEVVLGISSLGDSVYLQDGPGYENFIRKMSSYIFGGSGSNALARYIGELDQNESITLNTVFNGLSKVLGAELGNTKAYKGDMKNYYKSLNALKTFNYLQTNTFVNSAEANNNFSEENYNNLKSRLRKLFNEKAEFSKMYEVVIEHLENGGSLQEVKSALNYISIGGQLTKLTDKEEFLSTLNEKETYELEKAIMFEEENFPWLNEFRESVRQQIEQQYYGKNNNYVPRYYQPYYKMYGDSRNVYYRPYYSKYLQNPFNAYRSAWYTVNQIPPRKKENE